MRSFERGAIILFSCVDLINQLINKSIIIYLPEYSQVDVDKNTFHGTYSACWCACKYYRRNINIIHTPTKFVSINQTIDD